ncbi:MAG: hypothetical protein ABI475_04705 [Methylophilaceae bacterium]
MQRWIRQLPAALGLSAILVLPACVTINVYFPAADAEKAADKIIDEVWQLKNKPSSQDAPAQAPASVPAK